MLLSTIIIWLYYINIILSLLLLSLLYYYAVKYITSNKITRKVS